VISRTGGDATLQTGRIVFGETDAVAFGKPAANAAAEEARRLDAERFFLMVSGTLDRTTDEIAKVRRALGNGFAGLFERMPPLMPRSAVIEAATAAREAGADLFARIGGNSVTDGDALDAFIAGLGMPRGLGAVQIGPESFARIAEQAIETPWSPRNPRPITGPAGLREILELAASCR
jgi:alcohol dehydrogenase class IV